MNGKKVFRSRPSSKPWTKRFLLENKSCMLGLVPTPNLTAGGWKPAFKSFWISRLVMRSSMRMSSPYGTYEQCKWTGKSLEGRVHEGDLVCTPDRIDISEPYRWKEIPFLPITCYHTLRHLKGPKSESIQQHISRALIFEERSESLGNTKDWWFSARILHAILRQCKIWTRSGFVHDQRVLGIRIDWPKRTTAARVICFNLRRHYLFDFVRTWLVRIQGHVPTSPRWIVIEVLKMLFEDWNQTSRHQSGIAKRPAFG